MAKSVLVGLALVAALGPGQEPRVLQRRFTTELELATESFELTGTEDGRTEEQRPPRYVREQADEVELTDTLLDDGDPPAKFTRHYRTVAGSFKLGPAESPREKTVTAGLEGKTWWPWSSRIWYSGPVSQGYSWCGDAEGSWDPIGPWAQPMGRVCATALMTLALECPYRYPRVLAAR